MAVTAGTKYIGYLGGAAVAAGVGAAIAVAGAATASAETEAPKTEAPKSETSKPEAPKPEAPKPFQKLTDQIEKTAAQITKTVTTATAAKPKASTGAAGSSDPKDAKDSKLSEAGVSATQITVRKPTAKEFEAQQVERLKGLFQGTQAAAEDETGFPNPFRANDPEPVDVPEAVVTVRNTMMGVVGPDLAPVAREAVEQGYRATQMVPWVNAVVPITKIAPSLGDALNGDRDARQLIVNELIKTTPPGSFLFYGYDLVADLANREHQASEVKNDVFRGVWDLIDSGGLLHTPGESGIGNSLGN